MDILRKLFGKKEPSQKCQYPELDPYVERLVDISRRTATSSGSGYLRAGEDECQEIGEEICLQWDFAGMLYVYERIREKLGPGPARELEYAWDGICGWRG